MRIVINKRDITSPLNPQWGNYLCMSDMFNAQSPNQFHSHFAQCFSYLLSSSFGWFLLSRFLSMRSDKSCLRTPVAYSISPCSAVMMREATLPRSRMEKDRCASKVRMKVSRKCFLVSSWPNNVKAFSTLAGTWRGGDKGDDGEECGRGTE